MASTMKIAHPEPTDMSIEDGIVLREKMKGTDSKHPELRAHYWDQLHPRTGKFRSRYYENSAPWKIESETFMEPTENDMPRYLDWVRGTYQVEVTISDRLFDEEGQESDVVVPLKLSFDFTEERERCIGWTIDTRASQIHQPAAYPGIHSGFLHVYNHSAHNTFCDVIWDTPIFSPYVKIERPLRGSDREEFKAISSKSMPKARGGDLLLKASHVEKVHLGTRGSCYVVVLQEVLKDLARLLLFGPRYADMQLAPVVGYADQTSEYDDRESRFFENDDFPKAALLFSRAYCKAGADENEGDEEPVPDSHCMTSVETIEAMFEHYKIVLEPQWIKTSSLDWVDDLREEATLLKTFTEWREFEKKWATITSYACGLNLHEGPWAGENWRMCIDLGW